ncbi:transposase [Pseudomaricurvus alcaniphilus]|uniref:transposase n=1 Tax=Pseudomaricurvus alcaniphilus TaxID=1166482 RepID=UPI00140A1D56|nr:transposase [Pseudomaricurvus alcaniphilus]NHN39601.1 transposase [Pseudomaricurvus alcaniphilus]
MPTPRKTLIALEATPYYHCVSRCVRRAYLCGKDQATGASFAHRRFWIEERLLQLTDTFAIDVCAYAIMSNHYHVVLHVDRESAESWDRAAVINRWHRLFKGNPYSQAFVQGKNLSPAEIGILNHYVDIWRSRLMDISWYMRVLNEGIARQANREDECTGRFWEGRFKSQALLDEKALVACMAYVDLNPVRAGLAVTPETSAHTSIKTRSAKAKLSGSPNHPKQQARQLMPFAGNPRAAMPHGLPFRLTDYIELIDWTGRIIRQDKRGAIPTNVPPVFERLNIDLQHWLYSTRHFESRFKGLVGAARMLKQVCRQLGYKRTPGIGSALLLS